MEEVRYKIVDVLKGKRYSYCCFEMGDRIFEFVYPADQELDEAIDDFLQTREEEY